MYSTEHTPHQYFKYPPSPIHSYYDLFDQIICIENEPLFQNCMQKIRLYYSKESDEKIAEFKSEELTVFLNGSYSGKQKLVPSPQSLAKERGDLMNGYSCGLACQKTFFPGNLSYARDNGDIKADINVHREN